MERLSPAVLVEVGDEIVEADRRGTTASAVWGEASLEQQNTTQGKACHAYC